VSPTARPRLPWLKDRLGIPTPVLIALLALGLLPLALVSVRVLSLSAVDLSAVTRVGDWLNQSLQLHWIAAGDRDAAVTILLLPMAAILTALTRLTLGLRVLGFRAILMSIAFQEIGFIPSLILLLVVAAAVVLVRPLMRRSRMPLYARVSTILCIVALLLTLGLLSGVWLDSGTLWSMAFFPVVILAMLAESVAATVARDSLTLAFWRLGTTIALAAVIAGLSQIQALRELALAAPELVLTQLVAVLWISEFLDLRLFEHRTPGRRTTPAVPPVIVVRSRFGDTPFGPRGTTAPRRYRRASLQGFVDALRSLGHRVDVVEGDANLPALLRQSAPDRQMPTVINLSGGTQGRGRRAWVAHCCESLGLPYSGPTPQAPALWDDRLAQCTALESAGLRTPVRLTLDVAKEAMKRDSGEVVVRPRREADRMGTRVRTDKDLRRQVSRIEKRFGEVILEGTEGGRRVSAVLFDGIVPGSLSTVLLERVGRGWQAFNPCTDGERDALVRNAERAYAALGCRHIARVDLEFLDTDIIVWHVDAIDLPTRHSAVMAAATAIGVDVADLGRGLLHAARRDAGVADNPHAERPTPVVRHTLKDLITAKGRERQEGFATG